MQNLIAFAALLSYSNININAEFIACAALFMHMLLAEIWKKHCPV